MSSTYEHGREFWNDGGAGSRHDWSERRRRIVADLVDDAFASVIYARGKIPNTESGCWRAIAPDIAEAIEGYGLSGPYMLRVCWMEFGKRDAWGRPRS